MLQLLCLSAIKIKCMTWKMLHNAPLPLNQVGDIPVRLDLSMIDNMFVKKNFHELDIMVKNG